MGKMVTPLQYYGGKSNLSSWIITHFPPHNTFIDVFGGSAAVLLAKEPSNIEIYNDIDSNLVTFFRVLRCSDCVAELANRLRLTPYSAEEYYSCMDLLRNGNVSPDIDRAYAYFVVNRMSFSGRFAQGWKKDVTGGSGNVSKWIKSIDMLPELINRWRMVQVENEDFRYILGCYDSHNALFYLDPPYLGVENKYDHGLSPDDHEDMLDILVDDLKGMAVLSGYDNDLYDDLLDYDWMRVDKECKSSANIELRDKRIESLWLSPQVADWVEDQNIT